MATSHTLTATEMDILRRLERLPMTWVQVRLLLIGGLGYTFDAANNAALGFILPPVTQVFGLTDQLTGLMASSVMIGYLFGAFFAGTLGDLIGRKRFLIWALAIYCVATLCAAVAPNWQLLFFGRTVAGFGTGADAAIVAAYLSEFIQSRYRGRYIGSLAGFFSFGFVIAALLGYLVVPVYASGWRIIQVLTALAPLPLLWWRRSLPESPRWLLQQGRLDEAVRVVAALEASVVRRTNKPLPSLETYEMAPVTVRRGGTFSQNLKSLWSRSLRRNTAMLWLLWFSITFSFYGFFNWMPSLMVKQGLTITKSFGYAIVMYVAQIPGYYSAAFLNEKLDRKWTIILYMLGGAGSAFAMTNAGRDPFKITLFGFWLSFFMNGTYAGMYAYTPEVYPTSFRTTGMGVASAFGRVGGILAPLIIGLTFARIGFGGVFFMITAVLLTGALAVAILGIRTTGRTLEQITSAETEQDAKAQTKQQKARDSAKDMPSSQLSRVTVDGREQRPIRVTAQRRGSAQRPKLVDV
jgi:putative MFS transporter